jgi:hypothetical protein
MNVKLDPEAANPAHSQMRKKVSGTKRVSPTITREMPVIP